MTDGVGRGQVPDPEEEEKLVPAKVKNQNITKRNQRGCDIAFYEPADGRGSAYARGKMGQMSIANGNGTHRPPTVLTALNADRTRLYFMPMIAAEGEHVATIQYSASGFSINLYDLFAELACLVPAGFREVYKLKETQKKVTIGDSSGYAFYMELGSPDRQAVSELSEEEKAKRAAARAAKKQKKDAVSPEAE